MANYLKSIVFISGFIAVIVGLLVIIGWILDLPVLKSLNPEFISMKANTAVCFIFFGIAILLLNGNFIVKSNLYIARSLLSVIIVLSIITFIQYPLNINFGVDELLFNEDIGTAGTLYPGRMAGSTIVCFILLGISLLLTDSKFKWGDITSQVLALATGLISILPQLGYAYRESDLFTFAYQTPMALNTSITLLTASIGAFFMRPSTGFLKVFGSESLGGTFAKRLFPVLILIPILFIWVRLAVRAGGYDLKTIDLEIISILYIIVFIITFWRVFGSLNEVDEKRALAQNELFKAKEEAERVAENEKLTSIILNILNKNDDSEIMIRNLLEVIKSNTGIEAVGIRLRDGEDYPYYKTTGFPDEFVEAERYLCTHNESGDVVRDSMGNPLLECMCGNILCGRTDPAKVFFTEGGSFRSNHTTEMLATTSTEELLARTRNRCNSFGYESVALVPIRSGNNIIGLLQLNDHRKDVFNEDIVPFFEGIGSSIGIALMRNRAEDDLKNSERKYRKIFENIQDVFFHTDISDTILEISPSIFRIAGYRREELIGKKASAVYFNVETRDQLAEIMSKRGEVWDYEILLRTKDGKTRYTSMNAHLHFDAKGNLVGTEGLLRDIDDRKQFEIQLKKSKEKAEESDRLKTAFLQNISHEIRTPMNAIMGFTSLLGLPGNTAKTEATYIETIQSSSNQLLSIINDIVDVSSIEANTIKINITTFNLNETLKSLYNQYSLRSVEHNVALSLTTGLSDEMSFISTDSSRLIQIISNLINNAFKFSKKGAIEFGYKLKGAMIEFHVTDNGIGIHPDYHSKIFNSFYQVESEISMQYGGTGLGLSICKAYVELLGGEIWLTSIPGEGSVFYFNIPYVPVSLEPVSETKIADKPIATVPDKLIILVAEDDDMNFRLIEFFLKDLKATIIRAVNGIEAIEKCRAENRIALVLMDVKMPLMDGYIATKAIKEQFPGLAIIAQTAYFTDRDKAIRSGCSDFISKPFNKEQLIQKISQYLPKK